MKKMVKVILVCTAVLCAIDQIMRFTGPYAIAIFGTTWFWMGIMRPQTQSMRKSTANIASATRKYLKSLQTVSPALVKR